MVATLQGSRVAEIGKIKAGGLFLAWLGYRAKRLRERQGNQRAANQGRLWMGALIDYVKRRRGSINASERREEADDGKPAGG